VPHDLFESALFPSPYSVGPGRWRWRPPPPPSRAQTKWDLPAAYRRPTSTPRTCSSSPTTSTRRPAGKLKITVHANASLFKANEIKRAVQGGQAQIGEVLLVNFENENPIYGADGIPSSPPATPSRRSSPRRRSRARQAARGAGNDAALHRAVAAAGHLRQEGDRVGGRHARPEVARLQPGHRQDRRADRRAAGDVQAAELSQALATGVVESYMSSGSTGYDSKTYESIKYWYDTQAWLPKNARARQQEAFDALDKPTQDAVLKAAADAEERGTS
jgi:hypothetical protein